ncbi:MAG: hypothetical protein AAGC77_09845 [Pseudomonadota bacterium]
MAEHDAFARHEVLHMSLFLAEAVEAQLMERPIIKANPTWSALAATANEALLDLYQAIGAASDEPA